MNTRVTRDPTELGVADGLTRRAMLARAVLGAASLSALAALLSACGSSPGRRAALPGVDWPDQPLKGEKRTWRPLSQSRPVPLPTPPAQPGVELPTGVIPRSAWARGGIVPSLMDRAQLYYRITVHHDGMNAYTSTDSNATASRLELIRLAHRGRDFGDIGYHYLIDPAGRVWQGRPLQWQGAHVKATNQGNLGVCMLGNYQQQSPNPTQLAALDRFVASRMRYYNIRVGNVFTHQELAPTLCPGVTLQAAMVRTRRSGALVSA